MKDFDIYELLHEVTRAFFASCALLLLLRALSLQRGIFRRASIKHSIIVIAGSALSILLAL